MIESHWPRICGIHVSDDGQIAAVWIAFDKDADCLHVYDCHVHEREVIAVQADGLKSRGDWIPIAWHEDAKEIADRLLDRGCNIITEPVKDTQALAESLSLDILERAVTGRFKVAKHLKRWLDELETFQRRDMKVPRNTHPLMAATRHAVAKLEWAHPKRRKAVRNYPELHII